MKIAKHKVISLYLTGASIKEVSESFKGVSYERVRQIVNSEKIGPLRVVDFRSRYISQKKGVKELECMIEEPSYKKSLEAI